MRVEEGRLDKSEAIMVMTLPCSHQTLWKSKENSSRFEGGPLALSQAGPSLTKKTTMMMM
jgi:hypothetical protein